MPQPLLVLSASVSVEPIKQKITENKDIKVKKKFRKSQPYFQHYVQKIEAQAKKWFSYKKTCSIIIPLLRNVVKWSDTL